jgi:hypothetical protein
MVALRPWRGSFRAAGLGLQDSGIMDQEQRVMAFELQDNLIVASGLRDGGFKTVDCYVAYSELVVSLQRDGGLWWLQKQENVGFSVVEWLPDRE